jgi:hypothetical protein
VVGDVCVDVGFCGRCRSICKIVATFRASPCQKVPPLSLSLSPSLSHNNNNNNIGAVPLWVWAVGVGSHRPPPNVGYPIGGDSAFRYVALQVSLRVVVVVVCLFVCLFVCWLVFLVVKS